MLLLFLLQTYRKDCHYNATLHPFGHSRFTHRTVDSMSFFSTGSGLVLQHFRPNEECGVLEELEPIDSNLNYDSNYQVYTAHASTYHWDYQM